MEVSDRLGRRNLIILGWMLYAGIYLGFGLTSSTAALVALFLGYGVYFGLTEPVERAWVASLAPQESRGSAFGFYHGAIGLTALPASLMFGVIYATAGPAAAFGVGAALALVATALLLRVPTTAPASS